MREPLYGYLIILLVLDEIAELCSMDIVDEGLYYLTSFKTIVEVALGLLEFFVVAGCRLLGLGVMLLGMLFGWTTVLFLFFWSSYYVIWLKVSN